MTTANSLEDRIRNTSELVMILIERVKLSESAIERIRHETKQYPAREWNEEYRKVAEIAVQAHGGILELNAKYRAHLAAVGIDGLTDTSKTPQA